MEQEAPPVRVASLYVTQSKLRSIHTLRDYIDFVRQGGIFNSTELKIVVVSFEDGNYYVFDGHHR